MKRSIGTSAFLLSFLGAVARVAAIPSNAYEISAELTGVSGSVGGLTAVLPGGETLSVDATAGWLSAGLPLSNGSWTVQPGLWGADVPPYSFFSSLATPCGGATVDVPAGSVGEYFLRAAASPAADPVWASPAAIAAANQALSKTPYTFAAPSSEQICEVLITSADSAPLSNVGALLSFSFQDADGDGLLDSPAPLRAAALSVWALDEAKAQWVKLPSSADPTARSVSVPVQGYTTFALLGSPVFGKDDAHPFPVPWRAGGTRPGITFTRLPSPAKIRIYTLSGKLVRELSPDAGAPSADWDVKNADGDDAVTGTYIYIVESQGSRKMGKLVIVR